MPPGLTLRIENLDDVTRGFRNAPRVIDEVWREILRGPFGDEFLEELKARTSDATRTGYTLSRLRKHDAGPNGISIGIPSSDRATHPASKRANAYSVGVWLESGTRMHYIPTKVTPYNHLAFGGGFASRVVHPGTRGLRPAFRTLQLFKGDAERLLLRELDRRASPRIGAV